MSLRTRFLGLACLLPVFLSGGRALADDGRFIVGLRDQARGRAALAAHGGRVLLDLDPQGAVAAELPEAAVEALRRNPTIGYVEEDPRRYPLAQTTPYGIAMVQAPQAWPQAGAGSRKVCVIDSGMTTSHEDLPSGSSVTGYPSNWSSDGCGHGTHVIGTIAALDNDLGVVGAMPRALSLHVVRVFNSSCGWSYASGLVDALNRCRDAGANVVNMSLGGSRWSLTEALAFQQAWDAGLLSVAAAGNNGSGSNLYPASYDSVISVAAVDSDKKVASFSQHNSQVELAAPGVGVLSTSSSGGYATMSGTSMATPHVAGVAALVWSHDTSWTNAQLRAALRASAEDLGAAGRDDYYGYGLVRAQAALSWLQGANAAPSAAFSWSCTELRCDFADASSDADGSVVAWSWDFGGQGSSSAQNPSFAFSAAGTYTVALTVTDDGGATAALAQQVTVTTNAASLDLSATAQKRKGQRQAKLVWSGASGDHVVIYRDGVQLALTENDGAYTDYIGGSGAGSFEYQVCEQAGGRCSETVVVIFK